MSFFGWHDWNYAPLLRVSRGRFHRTWPHQVTWYFLSFRPCFGFHLLSLHPSCLLQPDHWDPCHHQCLSCLPGFVSCSFTLTPEKHMPRTQACPPAFLMFCQVNDLCALSLSLGPYLAPWYKSSPRSDINLWLLPIVWCPCLGFLIPNL